MRNTPDNETGDRKKCEKWIRDEERGGVALRERVQVRVGGCGS
jgi:hypothetical protein